MNFKLRNANLYTTLFQFDLHMDTSVLLTAPSFATQMRCSAEAAGTIMAAPYPTSACLQVRPFWKNLFFKIAVSIE